MLCYKDKSLHKEGCDRIITKEELEHAEKIGLPIAYINFCD